MTAPVIPETQPVLARLQIEAPLPPKELSPNAPGSIHYMQKARARADYRRSIGLLAAHERRLWERRNGTEWQPADYSRISLQFGIRSPGGQRDAAYRPKDTDNAVMSFKGGQDGLRDAGVIVDDDYRHLERGRVSITPDTEGLIIIVEVLRW